MKRSLVFMALVALLVLATAVTASAGFTWCMTDPNIKLPDGGVFHLQVGVPEEYRDTGFVLDVWAPGGSQIVGESGNIEVTVVLHEGQAGQVKAKTKAGFPVTLSAKYLGDELQTYEFENGKGTAVWDF